MCYSRVFVTFKLNWMTIFYRFCIVNNSIRNCFLGKPSYIPLRETRSISISTQICSKSSRYYWELKLYQNLYLIGLLRASLVIEINMINVAEQVRESLEALSMLFVNRPHQEASSLGEAHPSGIMGGADHHHHHKDS